MNNRNTGIAALAAAVLMLASCASQQAAGRGGQSPGGSAPTLRSIQPTMDLRQLSCRDLTVGFTTEFAGGLPQVLKDWQDRSQAGDANATAHLANMFHAGLVAHRTGPDGKPEDKVLLAKNPAEAARLFRAAAEQGHSYAQTQLALMLEEGQGVPKDVPQAKSWYEKAADQGNCVSQNNLANLLITKDPPGGQRNPPLALKWYTTAAQQGHPAAQQSLGDIYANGSDGNPKDLRAAESWYTKAAQQGAPDAQEALGGFYLYQLKDPAKGLPWVRKAAEQGQHTAEYDMFVAYSTGKWVPADPVASQHWLQQSADGGVAIAQWTVGLGHEYGLYGNPKNPELASKWMRASAEQGHAPAQVELAMMYYRGNGVPKDFVQMHAWLQKASAQGSARAKFNLFQLYRSGIGVPKDESVALKNLREASEQEYPDAEEWMGWAYLNGFAGLPKDPAQAFSWYAKAALQGNVESMTTVAALYYKGLGVNKSDKDAAAWLRKAAERDSAEGQLNLGHVLREGQGVKVDKVEAYKWFLIAARHADTAAEANQAIAALGKELSAGQQSEAKKQADAWTPER